MGGGAVRAVTPDPCEARADCKSAHCGTRAALASADLSESIGSEQEAYMRRRFSRRLVRLVRDCAGTNLIEAAIVTPLLLLLTFSIVDFASMFYVYLALENGVSQATRFAVTGQTMADPNNPTTQLNRISGTTFVTLTTKPVPPSVQVVSGSADERTR